MLRLIVSITVCLISSVALAAQDAQETQDAAMLQAGKEILEQARPLPPGYTFESYFAVHHGPDDIGGYVVTTLETETAGPGQEPYYRYKSDTVATIPNGARADMVVHGKLRRNFEPLELEVRRAIMKPGGEKQASIQRANFSADKVSLYAETSSDKASNDVAKPDAPFIYAIETLVQRLPLRLNEMFSIREFNITNGGAGRLVFSVDEWSDGTPTLVVSEPAGSMVYQFWFTKEGELIRWGEPSHPVMFIKTTKKQIDELKARFGPPDVDAED